MFSRLNSYNYTPVVLVILFAARWSYKQPFLCLHNLEALASLPLTAHNEVKSCGHLSHICSSLWHPILAAITVKDFKHLRFYSVCKLRSSTANFFDTGEET